MKIITLAVSILWPAICLADNPIVGTWKLQSFVREIPGSSPLNEFGENPNGYLTYTPDGRMHGIITRADRPKPRDPVPTDAERLKLYSTLLAYAGTYTVDKDKVVHHVDISWNESWNGTDQVRFYKIVGDTLTITTAAARSTLDGKEARYVLVWKKVKRS